jgi:DNA-directed RNA polymerase subunit L
MEVKVLVDEKDKLVIEMENQTVAELLRIYLNKEDAVELAAWRRDNTDKPVKLEIRTKGKAARKVFEDAAEAVEKDLAKISDEFKKSIK